MDHVAIECKAYGEEEEAKTKKKKMRQLFSFVGILRSFQHLL